MDGIKNILIVDDEPKIIEAVAAFLEKEGYHVFNAENGRDACDMFEAQPFALVLLDLMLPDMTGEEVCTYIRGKSCVPIIMLTAKTQESDLLRGLGLGADDYITKPFSLKALAARMEAVLRRTAPDSSSLQSRVSLRNGDLEVDFAQHTVRKNGVPVPVTPNEFKLLAGFIKFPSKVFTREEIIEITFGHDYEGFSRTIDSHIKNLRKKIECDSRNPVYIKTVHGVGYKFGGE